MRKAKLSTKSNTVAPPKHLSELGEAVERFESTKNATERCRESMNEWLKRVAELEKQMREAHRHLNDAQGALSYHEDKLMRERNDVQNLTYISVRKGPTLGIGDDCCAQTERVNKY